MLTKTWAYGNTAKGPPHAAELTAVLHEVLDQLRP
jgi:hypothetical protein